MFEEIKRPLPPLGKADQMEEYRRCQAESWIFYNCDQEMRLPRKGEVEQVMHSLKTGALSWGTGLYDETRTICFRGKPTLKARAKQQSQARLSFLASDWKDFFYLLKLQRRFHAQHGVLFLPWRELFATIFWPFRVSFRWQGHLRPCCFDSLRAHLKGVPECTECICFSCLSELRCSGKFWRMMPEPRPKKLPLPPFTKFEIMALADILESQHSKARSRAIDQMFRKGQDWSKVRVILQREIPYSGHRFDLFGNYLGRVQPCPLPPPLLVPQPQIT